MHTAIQNLYDEMSACYHLIYTDWNQSISHHAATIDQLLKKRGLDKGATILDCACGIGTQSLGLSLLGYSVIGSDLSEGAILRARAEAAARNVDMGFVVADFCCLEQVFQDTFDVVIAMDNALPHMTEKPDMDTALCSISGRVKPGGLFIASIRDYDELIQDKPQHPEPYIMSTLTGRRIAFQVWEWDDDIYDFTQYIIEDDQDQPSVYKFNGKYRAITRQEFSAALQNAGFTKVTWMMPEETGFYQPILVAQK